MKCPKKGSIEAAEQSVHAIRITMTFCAVAALSFAWFSITNLNRAVSTPEEPLWTYRVPESLNISRDLAKRCANQTKYNNTDTWRISGNRLVLYGFVNPAGFGSLPTLFLIQSCLSAKLVLLMSTLTATSAFSLPLFVAPLDAVVPPPDHFCDLLSAPIRMLPTTTDLVRSTQQMAAGVIMGYGALFCVVVILGVCMDAFFTSVVESKRKDEQRSRLLVTTIQEAVPLEITDSDLDLAEMPTALVINH